MGRKIYRVYRKGELIVDSATAEEIEELLGCKRKTVRKYALMGFTLNHEYTFEEANPEAFCELKTDVMSPFAAAEWERITKVLLGSGADLSKCVLVPEPGWR